MPPVAELLTTPPQPTAGPPPLRARPTPAIPAPNPVAAPSTERVDDAARAVLRFQQLMTSFLETQKQVMLAYLTSSSPERALDLESRRSTMLITPYGPFSTLPEAPHPI